VLHQHVHPEVCEIQAESALIGDGALSRDALEGQTPREIASRRIVNFGGGISGERDKLS
jgi:hypothetical protein